MACSVEGLTPDSGVGSMFRGVVTDGSGDVLKGWRGGGPKCGTDFENGGSDCGKD